MNRFVILFFFVAQLLVILAMGSCSWSSRFPNNANAKVSSPDLYLKVFSNGKIIANDNECSMKELNQLLSNASAKKSMVWFYREGWDSDPSEIALAVFQIINSNKLPLTLSTKPDFSTYVDGYGIRHDRK